MLNLVKTLSTIIFFTLIGFNLYAQNHDCEGQILVHPIILETRGVGDFDFIDSLLLNKNYFFLSEAHGNPHTFEVAEKLITYLGSIDKLDWVALETDYSHGYELNNYLETGNALRLSNFLKLQPDFATYENLDYFSHYQKLKAVHDSLGFEYKFAGIDVCKEGFKGSTFSILHLLGNFNASDAISIIVLEGNDLLQKKEISYRNMQKWVDKINFQKEQIRKSVMNENQLDQYEQLGNILFNVEQSLIIRSMKPVNREVEIAHNFQRYFDQNDDVYCQFGYGHVLTNRWPQLGDEGKSFVDWLETNSEYKGRSLIFAFSPNLEDRPEFTLFGDALCLQFKTEILLTNFPAIVDVRDVPAFNRQFQFVFIIDE